MKGRPMGRQCSRCGRLHKPRQCPAYCQTCHKCQRLHHFARKCLFGGSVTHMVEGSEEGRVWSAGRPHDQAEKGWEEAASRDAVYWSKRERVRV